MHPATNAADKILHTSIMVTPLDLRDRRHTPQMASLSVRVTEYPGRPGTFEIEALRGMRDGATVCRSGWLSLDGGKLMPENEPAYRELIAYVGKWIVDAVARLTSPR